LKKCLERFLSAKLLPLYMEIFRKSLSWRILFDFDNFFYKGTIDLIPREEYKSSRKTDGNLLRKVIEGYLVMGEQKCKILVIEEG